jgi:hypothetical protein
MAPVGAWCDETTTTRRRMLMLLMLLLHQLPSKVLRPQKENRTAGERQCKEDMEAKMVLQR